MRYDLCSPRPKKDGGTFWHRVGTMFPSDKGGFSIFLDSLPLPDKDGRLVVKAFEPRENDQRQQRQEPQGGGTYGGGGGDLDSEIPF